ncbi:hypothetical protein [Ectobacillus panaciterrae]|uniref:hypothetical protein n=1 Tax=Ectobacillus panaciterrae TaxID=363872 RepID=UPI00040F8CA2|nr:hypothetical protein [Ectobacillus panaciterrae]
MYHRQDRAIRKLIEVVIVFLAVFFIDSLIAADVRNQPSPFIIIILLFSLRYGWKTGLLTFLFTLGYYVIAEIQNGGDVLLLFYNTSESKWFFLYFFLAITAGVMRTAWQERYEDLHFINEEMKTELSSVQKAAAQLIATNKVLEQRLLQSETSISSVYQMMKALDQENIEIVTNEAISILSSYFQANAFGIYHVDSSQRTLRIKLRLGNLPQTIFMDEAKTFYHRLFTEKKITVKRSTDEAAAPVIAGPIVIHGRIRQILIIWRMDFYHLTEHNLHLLYWLLQIISDSAERAETKALVRERRKYYPETSIYYKKFFDEYAEIEQQRYEQYGQPYATFDLHVGTIHHDDLVKISSVAERYLREVDKVGFEEDRLLFLLPGTEPEYVESLRQRIWGKLREEVNLFHDA